MTSDTTPNPPPPTQWQLWDLILSHLHNAPSSKISISGAGRRVSQSSSYMCNDFYYASDDMQKAKIAYIRLQDNMEHSILQNYILPPLDCLENQIDVLASLLVQRFEEDGVCQVLLHHEPASLAAQHAIVQSITSRCQKLGYNGQIYVTLENRPRLPCIVPLIPSVSREPRRGDGISLHIGWQARWPILDSLDEASHGSKDELSGPRWWHALGDVVLRAVNENP